MNEKNILTAMGPLAELYNHPDVYCIMVDAHDRVLVDRRNEESPKDSGVKFASVEALNATIAAILAAAQVKLASGQTVVDTRLMDGSRMMVVLPPTAVNGPTLTLVKLPVHSITCEIVFKLKKFSPISILEQP